MSKFTFNRAGNLVEIYQGDDFLCAIFVDRLPDFVAAAVSARPHSPMTLNPQLPNKEGDVEARETELFKSWLRTVCFQAPPDAACDLAWSAWKHVAARASQQPGAQWIACSERMPDEGQDCLVLLCWDDQQPYIGIDTWHMGSERPLEFSSATIETGLEWAEHDYDEISHWLPLPEPPHPPTQRGRNDAQLA